MKKILFITLTAIIVLLSAQTACNGNAYADNKDIPITVLCSGTC